MMEFKTEQQACETMSNAIKNDIVVFDSRELYRCCVLCWLQDINPEFRISAFSNVLEVTEPDVVKNAKVVIICTDGMANGGEWLERQVAALRQLRTDLPIVVVADECAADAVLDLVAALDLQGYIPTSCSLQIAAAALRLVLAGGTYCPRVRANRRIPRPAMVQPSIQRQPVPPGLSELTPREGLVFDLVAQGTPNKIVAYKLGMSINTVKIHVHHIICKLGVQNRTQAAVLGRPVRGSDAIEKGDQPSGSHLFGAGALINDPSRSPVTGPLLTI